MAESFRKSCTRLRTATLLRHHNKKRVVSSSDSILPTKRYVFAQVKWFDLVDNNHPSGMPKMRLVSTDASRRLGWNTIYKSRASCSVIKASPNKRSRLRWRAQNAANDGLFLWNKAAMIAFSLNCTP
eukprot:TRINITY_DN1446_c0_g1_i8.p2 TRINITY_DN1446_c0_g1~~TRINITY_DN1446_c0_g1_i8.p2  ORF type:complete len:127 (+),score=8.86 TRINITY_DN1446_c0_g1_i8:154-534(+)